VKVCEELDSTSPKSPDLATVNTSKSYYQYIHIGAIKLVISVKIEKGELDFDPKKGFGILTVVLNIFAGALSISESPIKFKELVLENIFSS
jgi:hypothetical protein